MSSLSRREFLQLSALSLGAAATPRLRPLLAESSLGRVTYQSVSVYDAPLLDGNQIAYRFRDELLDLEYALTPLRGPAYNPRWYRIDAGYVHSAFIQPVTYEDSQPLTELPEAGRLCRVSVPMTTPYHFNQGQWEVETRYQLYYDSQHWVTAIVDGPDGAPWYEITEAWEGITYYAAAAHLAPIPYDDYAPFESAVPDSQKRIQVSLAAQTLTAYEGSRVVSRVDVSTGVPNSGAAGLPTETPTGTFNISSKLPAKYMGDSRLTDNLGDKFLTGVPWVMFFETGGYALHGAYWHNNFGAPMSKGCVNLRPADAQWLYRWVSPVALTDEWDARGFGTSVVVS
jgi:lipoprotein-anchoring transpeptidase ErfK/SrfK